MQVETTSEVLGTESVVRAFYIACVQTGRSYVTRQMAYTIEVIRWPLYPIMYFLVLSLTYQVSGRTSVDGMSPEGFLFVGTIGMVLWTSSIWTGGYAIELERYEGTIQSLLLTPGSRSGVVLGYTLGSLAVFIVPSILLLFVLAILLGAEFNIADPLAVICSALALLIGSIALGYFLAGAFVLSRRANMFANFFQQPIYLLSGMVVPVAELPEILQWFAFIFPISAAMTALRETLLAGASLDDVAVPLLQFGVFSFAFALGGWYLLRRVEHVAKRGGALDLD